ncbi:GPI3 [Hepatospora eriocheir]|uniref:GPI3 n=1 Tax=Hepatospora eriocheir TaxID=1081669 RepID=A0A1X0QBZ5_9MICR|nr:GPI3 [Hepatospora eriocheir]
MNIAFISDHFYPGIGEVESHLLSLASEFVKLGHNVIVITRKYNSIYNGCIKMNGFLVYYLDLPIMINDVTWPMLFSGYLFYSKIFTKHKIELVHGQQSTSTMCIEGIFHANNMEIKTVLTDHSILEFDKPEILLLSFVSRIVFYSLDRIICVSKPGMENTQIRLKKEIDKFNIISNGIDFRIFYPHSLKGNIKSKFIDQNDKMIKILVCTRFKFRKGIDLLIKAIPLICANKTLKLIY